MEVEALRDLRVVEGPITIRYVSTDDRIQKTDVTLLHDHIGDLQFVMRVRQVFISSYPVEVVFILYRTFSHVLLVVLMQTCFRREVWDKTGFLWKKESCQEWDVIL